MDARLIESLATIIAMTASLASMAVVRRLEGHRHPTDDDGPRADPPGTQARLVQLEEWWR
jgi:hypothetical protein